VENTANRTSEQHAAGLIVHGPTGYITAVEREGQQQMVSSSWLPVQMLPAVEAALVEQGVVLGRVVADDPLFRVVRLPAGWSREADDERAVWSYLVDESGVRRFRVFYRAAHYDRKAHVTRGEV
jgi:hypothetical protein